MVSCAKNIEISDKINLGKLKALKKWNFFWEQCIAINQVLSISGLIFACCLSKKYDLQIIWKFWLINDRQSQLFTTFSDFADW